VNASSETSDGRVATSRAINEMQHHAADAANLMRAFGNESRLMILCTLADGERSVGELNEIIPLSQSALSQQLARLRRDGLVKTRREAQVIHYSLCDGPATRVIRILHEIFCSADSSIAMEGNH